MYLQNNFYPYNLSHVEILDTLILTISFKEKYKLLQIKKAFL